MFKKRAVFFLRCAFICTPNLVQLNRTYILNIKGGIMSERSNILRY